MKKLILALMLTGSALFFSGCFKVDSNFTDVRDVVLNEVDGSFGDVVEIHLGGFPLTVAGVALHFVDDPEAEEALEYIGGIDEVEVGVYELRNSKDRSRIMRGLKGRLDPVFAGQGFERILSHREHSEWVSIYVGLPDGSDEVHKMFVVVIDHDECVLVRLGGKLSAVVRAAANNHLKDVDWREFRDLS